MADETKKDDQTAAREASLSAPAGSAFLFDLAAHVFGELGLDDWSVMIGVDTWCDNELRKICISDRTMAAVQILASHHSKDGTRACFKGIGNQYALIGMAQQFLDFETTENQMVVIDKNIEDEEDEEFS